MTTYDDHFVLQWGVGAGVKSKQFYMDQDGADHAGKGTYDGIMTSLDGYSIITRVAFHPRQVAGVVRIDDDGTIADPWGTLAELEEASLDSNLYAMMWTDSASWPAKWTNAFQPMHLDPVLTHWRIPMRLIEVRPTGAKIYPPEPVG
jgi:hypothetical protein